MPITEPKFNKDAMPFDEDTFDCIKPKSLEEATRKARTLLKKTKSNLAKKGKGPKTDADKECLESIMELSLLFVTLLYPIILARYCIHNGMFRVRKLTKDLSKRIGVYRLWKNGQWKSGGAFSKSIGFIGRMGQQLSKEEVHEVGGVYFILEDMLQLIGEGDSKLAWIVKRIVAITPITQVYEDHQEKVFHEMLIFLFELTCHGMFSCTPGWVMELPLDFGSDKIHNVCTLPASGSNKDAVTELEGVERIRPKYTWATCISVLRNFLKDHGDKFDQATKDALEAIIHSSPKDGFLQNHKTRRLLVDCNMLEEYENAVEDQATFEAGKDAGIAIKAALDSNDSHETIKENIQKSMETIDNKSVHSVRYVEPPDGNYTESELKQMMHLSKRKPRPKLH